MTKRAVVACAVCVAVSVAVKAQPSSAGLAHDLVEALQQQKLEAIAAVDPSDPNRFVAALYSAGQLLVVSARHPAPAALTDQLGRKEYHDVYRALSGTSMPESKFFVQDLGADGLHNTPDSIDVVYEKGVDQLIFDGRPEAHKINKRTYAEKYQQAEDRYDQMLKLLLGATRGTTTIAAR
jgi:hypothetical protein